MSQNRPMMPQKRPKIRTPPHHALLAIPQPAGNAVDPELDLVQARGPRDRERLLHDRFGAAVPANPRLTDPLFQVKVRPEVGRHVGETLFATLPPASEPDVIAPERRGVHQLDHRVARAL